jgi:hypothetical protein
MPNGRCRLHGGLSTGPLTKEGLARSRMARFKHGGCSEQAREQNRRINTLIRQYRETLKEI